MIDHHGDRWYHLDPETVTAVIRFEPATSERTAPVSFKGKPYAADRGISVVGHRFPTPGENLRTDRKTARRRAFRAAHGVI